MFNYSNIRNDFGYDTKITNNIRDHGACLSTIEQSPENLEKILAWLKNERGIFTFSGNPGSGKTFLCKAIYNDWIEKSLECRFMYITEFFNSIRSVIDKGWDYSKEVHRLAEVKWFILDDLGASSMTEWQKEVIEDFINARHESMLPTLITTNLSESEFKRISPRIHSRLKDKSNLFISVLSEDKRQQQIQAVAHNLGQE